MANKIVQNDGKNRTVRVEATCDKNGEVEEVYMRFSQDYARFSRIGTNLLPEHFNVDDDTMDSIVQAWQAYRKSQYEPEVEE